MRPTSAILRAGIIFKLSSDAAADADGTKLSTSPGIATCLYRVVSARVSAKHKNAISTEFGASGDYCGGSEMDKHPGYLYVAAVNYSSMSTDRYGAGHEMLSIGGVRHRGIRATVGVTIVKLANRGEQIAQCVPA